MKWILELGAADFPDVLIHLEEMSPRGGYDPDPFATGPSIAEFLRVAMARWYELEGEAVLQFMLSRPEVLAESDSGELFEELLRDGYRRDPTFSFQLLKKYAASMVDTLGVDGISDTWRYQLGRWSEDFAVELPELVGLEEAFGESARNDDPFATDPTPELALIRGLIDAGRGDEARALFAAEDPERVKLLDSYLDQKRTEQLSASGWQDLKAAIDSGELGGDLERAKTVLEGWVGEDSSQALTWFLDQKFEGVARSSQIREVAFSKAFYTESDGMARSSFDVDKVMTFLDQMKEEGEPVEDSFASIVESVVYREDWDDLERLRQSVSPDVWTLGMNLLKDSKTGTDYINLGGKSGVVLPRLTEQNTEVLDRFGILNEVHESIAEAKEVAFLKLREMVEGRE
ncbi:MAG: hypothetical protein ACI9NQ_000582 [Paracoccaceae bacterium]|jgi:hypothetical protein